MDENDGNTATAGAPLLVGMTEAARLLGIGRSMMWQLVWDGEVPSARIGRRVLVARADLERFARQRVSPG